MPLALRIFQTRTHSRTVKSFAGIVSLVIINTVVVIIVIITELISSVLLLISSRRLLQPVGECLSTPPPLTEEYHPKCDSSVIRRGVLLAVWRSLCVSSIRARSSLSVRELYFSLSLLCYFCTCCVCGRRPYFYFFFLRPEDDLNDVGNRSHLPKLTGRFAPS